MNIKMSRENNYHTENLDYNERNYNTVKTIKPKPGLSIAELDNIPKNIRNKHNTSYTSINNSNNQVTKERISSALEKEQYISRENSNLDMKRNLSKNYSNSYLTIKSSRERLKSNPKQSTTTKHSPGKNVYKSFRCHKYHTDLDINHLSGEKFVIDSLKCGREKHKDISLKNSSPDGNNYDNRFKNYYDQNLNWVKNLSLNSNQDLSNYHAKDDDILKISNMEQEFLDESKQFVKKSSNGILYDVLDNKFSVNSPSRMKKFQEEVLHAKNQEYIKGLQSKENEDIKKRTQVKSNNFNSSNHFNQSIESKNKIYIENEKNAKLTVNLSYFGEDPSERFIGALENILSLVDSNFENFSISQKIENFLKFLEDQRRSIRLGALVGIYLLLKKYRIDDYLKQTILEKILHLLSNYENQEELFLVSCHEICSLFPKHELLLENINLICMFLTDFNFPLLQKASFNCLMSMQYNGIRALVELASKDHKDYQQYILTNLLNTPHIQKIIIVRALLNDIYSNNAERRHSALAALNRLHDLISDNDTLTSLNKFFNDHRLEKIFLCSTLRTAGIKGEKILLNEIKSNKDYSVRVAIASVMDYRLPKDPRYLRMRLDKNDAYSLTKNIPGKFCTYYGKVSPYVHETKKENDLGFDIEEEFLEVSTRDFLASLKRMISMNYDHADPQIVHRGSPFWLDSLDLAGYMEEKVREDYHDRESALNKYLNMFRLLEENSPKNITDDKTNNELNERGEYLISEEVIKALCVCLKDYSTAVRDTAVGTLGRIGLPEGLLAIDYLINNIKDEDVNVKSKIIWTIGRISQGCDNQVIPYIVNALKSNMWKVKCACFYTLSQFGSRSARLAVPPLIKLLKESAINKQTIAETLVKLGNEGENTLLNLMNTESDSNYKLKAVIAKSLALSNIHSPNIDFIVECLFKSAKSNSSLIRQNCLFAIRVLAEKSEDRNTYLKKKNLIPFYYEMMMDKEQAIQAVIFLLKI